LFAFLQSLEEIEVIILFPGAGQVVFLGKPYRPEITGVDTGTAERTCGEVEFIRSENLLLAAFRFSPAMEMQLDGQAFSHMPQTTHRGWPSSPGISSMWPRYRAVILMLSWG